MISGLFLSNLGRFSVVFNSMCWTEEHHKVLVREIIANNPFDGTTKKGTPARGAKWNAVINQLLQIREPSFKVGLDQKAVRNRYNLLALKYRQKIKEKERASGISIPELTELEKRSEVQHGRKQQYSSSSSNWRPSRGSFSSSRP